MAPLAILALHGVAGALGQPPLGRLAARPVAGRPPQASIGNRPHRRSMPAAKGVTTQTDGSPRTASPAQRLRPRRSPGHGAATTTLPTASRHRRHPSPAQPL
jgi:hypothetical protein